MIGMAPDGEQHLPSLVKAFPIAPSFENIEVPWPVILSPAAGCISCGSGQF